MAPIRAVNETVVVEQVGNTLTERAQTIINASLTGQISSSEAAILLPVLPTPARVIDTDQLESRLKVLEQKSKVYK